MYPIMSTLFGSPIPLKQPITSTELSIQVRKLEPHDLFLIFALDCLLEHLSDEAVVQIVFKKSKECEMYIVGVHDILILASPFPYGLLLHFLFLPLLFNYNRIFVTFCIKASYI